MKLKLMQNWGKGDGVRFLILPAVLALSVACLPAQPPSQLSVQKASIQQYEDGPPVTENYVWMPGEIVHMSFLISGFKVSTDQKIKLTYKIDALDPRGIKLIETVTGKVDAELAPEDKEWLPKVRGTIPIPPLADSGDYTIHILVKDELADTEATKDFTYPVRGRNVEQSDTLVVRNFRFLRTEEDKNPLAQGVFRPGDPVWARFEITGYKLAEKNRFDVEYGLDVMKPSGDVIYSIPQAAVEKNESFYPKRYVLGVLNLNTKADTRPGEYTILLKVKDNIGGQTYESKFPFRIE